MDWERELREKMEVKEVGEGRKWDGNEVRDRERVEGMGFGSKVINVEKSSSHFQGVRRGQRSQRDDKLKLNLALQIVVLYIPQF